METIRSFDAVVDARARVLVVGSMPGAASLSAGQYYAHPRNRFWPLMERIVGIPATEAYEARLEGLLSAGIGLWDAIAECGRDGSLDSEIDNASAKGNDLLGLISAFPGIRRVCCNGAKAYEFSLKSLGRGVSLGAEARVEIVALPSTSPANASKSLDLLIEAWSPALSAAAISLGSARV